jgi:hypothetical protein
MKEFRDLWSSRISAQIRATSESTEVSEELHKDSLHMDQLVSNESLQSPGLYAQHSAGVPTLTGGLNSAPTFLNLFVNDMSVPNLLSAAMQPSM